MSLHPIVFECSVPTYFILFFLIKGFYSFLKSVITRVAINFLFKTRLYSKNEKNRITEYIMLIYISLFNVSLHLSMDPQQVCNNDCNESETIKDFKDEIQLIIKRRILNLISHNNFFILNDKKYKQYHGFSNGLHISCLLSECTLRQLENKNFSTYQLTPHP